MKTEMRLPLGKKALVLITPAFCIGAIVKPNRNALCKKNHVHNL